MTKQLRILLVEDSEDDALLVLREVERGGYEPICLRVETADTMRDALAEQEWDLVISDYRMPRFSAPEAQATLKNSGLDLPFIIVSGNVGEQLAVDAMRAGAHDYLMKGNLSRLVPAIERELREAEVRSSRRTAEVAIRRGKREWEAVFDAVSDLIILSDRDGRIVRCNSRVREYLKRDYPELVGEPIRELLYGLGEAESGAFRFPREMVPTVEEELQFPALAGWFSVVSYPMRIDQGEIPGLVFILRDITSRRREEEQRRVIERELLALYSIALRLNSKSSTSKVMGDILFQLLNMLKIDFSCIHLLKNNVLELQASLGLTPAFEAAIGSLSAETPWVSIVLAGQPYKASSMGPEVGTGLLEAARDMGVKTWCAIPMRIGFESIGMLMVAYRTDRDCPDREVFLLSSIASQLAVLIENHTLYAQMREKTVELERGRQELRENLKDVKRANIELGRLNSAKNKFIGTASHELKTPITSVLGGVELLLYYSNLVMTPEQRSILESVHDSILELKKLVEDLLSLSRIEAQGVALDSRPHDILGLFRETADTLALPLSNRNLQIRFEGDPCSMKLDSALFRLVARNLLENAIKFTPDGGTITISARELNRRDVTALEGEFAPFYPHMPRGFDDCEKFYRLDVADTGIGIPEEERVRVFDKFYGLGELAHHTSGKTEFMAKGSGLGLSIVRGLMEAHEGVVWNSASPAGPGTVFTLLLPLTRD